MTLVFRDWYATTDAFGDKRFESQVSYATEGEDGVSDIYFRHDGWVEIRHDDYEKDYWVPASQALAYRNEET